MKRWPIVIIVFYVLAVVGQSPWCYFVVASFWKNVDQSLGALVLTVPSLIVLVGGGLLLLAIRVEIRFQRLQARRSIAVPATIACLLFLLLVFCALLSFGVGKWGDGFSSHLSSYYLLLWMLFLWCVWALLFYRYFKAKGTESFVRRTLNWLLAGSVLELLVAVPSHIISCRRHDCCAPILSLWGISIGLSIMLLSLGPGVVFLYMERIARKKRRAPVQESST